MSEIYGNLECKVERIPNYGDKLVNNGGTSYPCCFFPFF